MTFRTWPWRRAVDSGAARSRVELAAAGARVSTASPRQIAGEPTDLERATAQRNAIQADTERIAR